MQTPSSKPPQPQVSARHEDVRARALQELQRYHVLMVEGHFDYGNGYHGRVYLNPHQIFQEPSLVWRLAQELIDLLPSSLVDKTEVVAGPVTGGALLAHTVAGLLDGRRSLSHPPCRFAPFTIDASASLTLRQTYAGIVSGKHVLLADDVRNTGKTLEQCAELVSDAGGIVVGTAQIHDRLESIVDLGVPNVALAEYKAPPNYQADACPLCQAGTPIAAF
jgi:orotate phosphoribosyltransferase